MVLAAGTGSRFGATKQLVEVAGRPLVAHAVATARDAGADEVVVVVGHDGEAVAAAARREAPVEVVVNPAYASGQATSFVAGIEAAEGLDADVAVVLLADQPAVSPAAVRAVVDAVVAGAAAARARYDDGPSHPVAFARRVWSELRRVRGDRGARDLLADLDAVEVAVAGPAPADVDTPDDLPDRDG